MVAIIASFGLLFSQTNASQLVSQPDATLGGFSHANGDSGPSIISPDGRYVLFSSAANNLVLTTSTNPIPLLIPARLNVYLRDCSNDVMALASVNLAGTGGGNGDSFAMGISSNGQFALFESSATDLVPGDPNPANNMAKDIFLRDVVNGTTTLVSVSTNGGFGNGISRTPVMTPDGRYVAFVSAASNLVAGDANGIPDIFVRDMQLGTTTLASPGAMPTSVTPFTSGSASPAITPDGHYVVFYSTATNLVPGVTIVGDIYVRDLVGKPPIGPAAAGALCNPYSESPTGFVSVPRSVQMECWLPTKSVRLIITHLGTVASSTFMAIPRVWFCAAICPAAQPTW